MGNMQQDAIAARNNMITLPFAAANVPDADGSATTINADSPAYVMRAKGSIVGLTVRHNADLTGGVITWKPTINGTAVSGFSVVTDDTNQQAIGSIASRAINFAAGDRIGLAWTETGTVAPTTTDVVALIDVLYEGLDF